MSCRHCPSCGGEIGSEASYCPMCGGNLAVPGLDARGRLLFFSTPVVFLLAGILLALDLGLANPVEVGAGIGLSFLSMTYLITGCGAWIVCRAFGISFRPTMPWRAGMFGTFELIACALLALPLQEIWMPDGVPGLTLRDEEHLKVGFVFAAFLPLGLLGLAMLVGRDQTPRHWACRFGAVPVFLGTILGFVLLGAALPEHRREFLFARVAADIQLREIALGHLGRSLAIVPTFAPALHLRGLLRMADRERATEETEGLQDLEQAARLAPGRPRYLFGLALGLAQAGRHQEAEDTASRAIDLKPFDPLLWAILADIRLKQHDKAGAVEAYRESLRHDPDDARVLNNLAYTLLELNQDLGLALELARASVERLPGHIFNLDTLAWALYKNEQAGEAYRIMLDIMQSVATPPVEIEFHYAAISHKLGLLPEPRQTFETLWKHPDVQTNPTLRQEIARYIASLSADVGAANGETAP